MIHLITNAGSLFPQEDSYRIGSIDEVITYLKSVEETSVDSETTGLCCHIDKMLLFQVGDAENQYVVDTGTVDIRILKPYLEKIILILQNAKFDLKFLYKKGIWPRKIWDTFVVEKIIHCGLPEVRCGLDAITERYLGFALDKSVRSNIPKEGLTTRVIKYSADDVKYLGSIKTKQVEILNERNLMGVANLENRFTPALAYIEFCGFKLDVDKWRAKMEKDNKRLSEAKNKLNDWVIAKDLSKFISSQLNLFEPVGCKINWSSPKQVIEIFEDLGVNCTVIEKGAVKKSVEAPIIEKQKDSCELIGLYLEYKQAEKVTSTYGENFLKQINPVTGRIHTQFKQIMDTGRISSGGKDRSTKEEYINFQNIPSDPETRACFVAENGNTLIISDYSGQEQIVLANKSMDGNILKFYDEGLGDMHSFVASKMYPELEGLTLDEIKKTHKDKRQEAKVASFAINYGGVGQTIANQLGKSSEDGERVYTAYFTAFPGLKNYFDKMKKQGLETGYVYISELTHRKSYIPFYKQYKDLEAKTKQEGFWTRYRKLKAEESPDFLPLKQIVSEFFRYKGDIERKCLNFPIQGTSAEITKISCVYIYDYIINNDLQNIALFVNTVHDENVLECPIEISEKVSEVVEHSMGKAGALFCKRVPLRADPELSTYWKK